MSDSTDSPAVLSAEEKRRLLRERRQAKMAKGQATDRLNNILSQGSSVKTTGVKSVLDEPQPTATSSAIHDEDPDIQDISEIASPPPPTPPIGEGSPENIDDIFQKMLQQQVQGKDGKVDPNDPIVQIMNMFKDGSGADAPQEGDVNANEFSNDPVENKYQQDLQAYNTYQQKLWKSRFLVIRVVVTLFNFFYHYLNVPSFHASNYSYVRDLAQDEFPVRNFFTWFAAFEVIIVLQYYTVFHKLGLFHAANQNSMIMKLMSMGSMVLPQLNTYQPLVARFLGYYELFGIIFGDLSLVIVLFGLLSFTK